MRGTGHADVVAVIAAGGALGGLARWGLDVLLPRSAGAVPWARRGAARLASCR